MQRQMPLTCTLTDEERLQRAQKMSSYVAKLDDLQLQKKAAASQFNTAIKDTEAMVRGCRQAIDEGTEERMVDIRIEPDVSKWEMVTIRLDTEEEVDRRGMSQEERAKHGQTEMFDGDEGDEVEASADDDGEAIEDGAAEEESASAAADADEVPKRTRRRKNTDEPTPAPAEAH